MGKTEIKIRFFLMLTIDSDSIKKKKSKMMNNVKCITMQNLKNTLSKLFCLCKVNVIVMHNVSDIINYY